MKSSPAGWFDCASSWLRLATLLWLAANSSAQDRETPTAAFKQAVAAIAEHNLAPALTILREGSETSAWRNELFAHVTAKLLGSDDGTRSMEIFGELADMVGRVKQSDRARAALHRGDIATNRGDYEVAIDALLKCQAIHPADHLFAADRLIAIYLARGAVADAWHQLELLKKVPGVDPRTVAVRQADLLLRVGQADPAANLLSAAGYQPIDDQNPTLPPERDLPAQLAIDLWVDIALWNEQFEDAILMIDAIAKAGRTSPRLQLGHATASHRLGKSKAVDSLRALATTDAIEPHYRANASALVAEDALQHGDVDAAAAILAQLPNHARSLQLDVARARVAIAQHHSNHNGDPSEHTLADVRTCATVLNQRWDDLIEQWHKLPVLPGGIAFLQIVSRRDLLSACLACDAILTPETNVDLAWSRLLSIDAANTLAKQLALAPTSLAAVRDHLVPTDGALLSFVPAHGSSFVLWLTADDAAVLPMPSDRDLRTNVQALQSQLQRCNMDRDRDQTKLHELAARIADVVLPTELRTRLHGVERVAIHGRELVAGLPFACLPWTSSEQQYFGLAKAVHYQPCLTLATHLATQGSADLTVDLMVAGATSHPEDAKRYGVPATTIDAERLHNLLPRSSTTTRQTVMPNSATTKSEVFHPSDSIGALALFAHGIVDATRVRPAGLILARGNRDTGEVFADSLPTDAKAPARMVLLCTCGAARGALRRGDDASRHLGGALLQLGTHVVGIADGDLEVHGTERLVRNLFAEVSYGEAPDRALLLARRRIAQDGHLTDWALLRLEGLAGHKLLDATHTSTRPPKATPSHWTQVLLSPWTTIPLAGAAVLLVLRSRRRRA